MFRAHLWGEGVKKWVENQNEMSIVLRMTF